MDEKKDTMKINVDQTIEDLIGYISSNKKKEITSDGLASCLGRNKVEKDRKHIYEVRRNVSRDISSLIEEQDYMTALSIIENNSELMNMSPFYAGLALSLSDMIYKGNNAHAITKKMGEELVKYCKSKCDYFKE